MRKKIVEKIELGAPCFLLGYYDRELTLPFLETYFYLGKDIFPTSGETRWFFQAAKFYLIGTSATCLDECNEKGIIKVVENDLDNFVDWQELIDELCENKALQDQGKFLSQRR